jgi:hypothetical protein
MAEWVHLHGMILHQGSFSTGSLIVRRVRTVEPSVSYGGVGSPSQHGSSPGFFSTGSLIVEELELWNLPSPIEEWVHLHSMILHQGSFQQVP